MSLLEVSGLQVWFDLPQGQQVQSWPGVKIRSHKWVTGSSCF